VDASFALNWAYGENCRFMKKNPKGLMPVLRDGEEWIQDSDKIAEHLEKKYPEVSLATPKEFKQV
jgi:glutathione S-transferase